MKKYILALLILLNFYSFGAIALTSPLSCKIKATDQINELSFTVTNHDTLTWTFLSWGTPFDAWFSQFMTISTVDGVALIYQGALAKRGQPSAQDMIRISAGKTLSVKLDLNQAYQIPPANYLVKIRPFPLTQLGDPKTEFLLRCAPFTLRVPESAPK
jgi:hypothetical protein